MGEHINKHGQFQSDKYPWCKPGFVPLKVTDQWAWPFLWGYAQERRKVDAAFADDLETALRDAGYEPDRPRAFDGADLADIFDKAERKARGVALGEPTVQSRYDGLKSVALAVIAKACDEDPDAHGPWAQYACRLAHERNEAMARAERAEASERAAIEAAQAANNACAEAQTDSIRKGDRADAERELGKLAVEQKKRAQAALDTAEKAIFKARDLAGDLVRVYERFLAGDLPGGIRRWLECSKQTSETLVNVLGSAAPADPTRGVLEELRREAADLCERADAVLEAYVPDGETGPGQDLEEGVKAVRALLGSKGDGNAD